MHKGPGLAGVGDWTGKFAFSLGQSHNPYKVGDDERLGKEHPNMEQRGELHAYAHQYVSKFTAQASRHQASTHHTPRACGVRGPH